MKKILTFCCALLGFGATMYGASADLSDYLNSNSGSSGDNSSSFTITTNEDGTLTFSGSYTDTEEDSDASYSVSFDIAAEANNGDTYTVTMSNFAISGSLSSAFSAEGDTETVTASATGITYIKVSAGVLDNIDGLPIEITGEGNGKKTVGISDYLKLLDLLGKMSSAIVSQVTVTMTCTSDAKLSIKVGDTEFVTCGFAVTTGDDDVVALSFSAEGLKNIFDTLTVEGEIEKVEAGEEDITNNVVIYDNVAYNFDDDVWSDWQAGANADGNNKYWPTDYTDSNDVNGLSFIKGEGSLYFQTNNASCRVGTDEDTQEAILYTPAYRVQLGGSGKFMEKACIGVPVEGACSIYVVAASGSSQATVTDGTSLDSRPRLLVASYDGGSNSEVKLTTEEYTWTEDDDTKSGSGILVPASENQGAENCLFEIEYTEATATTVYLYSSNSGINIFYIYVSYDGTEPVFPKATEDDNEPEAEAGTEEGTPELSTLYTFTGSVTITIASDPTSDNLDYGAVNQYNATSLLQLANIDGFGEGDFSGLTEDDIVTVTVTIDFTNCTATNYDGLKVALQGFDTNWGGWSSVDSPAADASAVELTVTATIGELMEVNNITDYTDFGGFALQIWNLSADNGASSSYEGAVVTYILTIEEGTSTAIANIKSDAEVVEVARYNLMGQKISGAEKGINIIVYSDGSAKKVLVK